MTRPNHRCIVFALEAMVLAFLGVRAARSGGLHKCRSVLRRQSVGISRRSARRNGNRARFASRSSAAAHGLRIGHEPVYDDTMAIAILQPTAGGRTASQSGSYSVTSAWLQPRVQRPIRASARCAPARFSNPTRSPWWTVMTRSRIAAARASGPRSFGPPATFRSCPRESWVDPHGSPILTAEPSRCCGTTALNRPMWAAREPRRRAARRWPTRFGSCFSRGCPSSSHRPRSSRRATRRSGRSALS
mgnify:CR=1 FL=1